MTGVGLFGRERELSVLEDLVGALPEQGGALVVVGEPGIGKSALVEAAARGAASRGLRVLTTAGVQSEAHLPFAGLHQLLRPLLPRVDELPPPQRAAMLAAFGMGDDATPELFAIALAALTLISDSAAEQPVVLIAEDAHWLDRATGEVLAFVARRLASDPIVLLATAREDFDQPLAGAALPELRLERLEPAAAGELLDARAPGLAPAVRARVLGEAAGNPLALAELPVAWHAESAGEAVLPPDWLPLTARLERAFAARASELPDAARALLLVAAVDDAGVLGELLAAASAVAGRRLTLDDLAPALEARLVELDGVRLRFRHPLVRSALGQAAGVAERHAAHAALADTIEDQPDRRAWHRAAAAIGPDEEVALELEAAAARALRRGATGEAVAALERAARLSGDFARRAERLLRGAELAFELGRRELVQRLLAEAAPLELDAQQRARLMWVRASFDDDLGGEGAGADALVDLARCAAAAGDSALALKLLHGAAVRCGWREPRAGARDRVAETAGLVPVDPSEPRLLAVLAIADPIGQGATVCERLAGWAAGAIEDPVAAFLLGQAAFSVGELNLARRFFTPAAAGLRTQGRLALLSQTLLLHAWCHAVLGERTVARPLAEEGLALARETGQPFWATGALSAQALLAGLRGDFEAADALAAEAQREASPAGVDVLLADAELARGVTAVGAGRHADAYAHLRRLFDPADPAYHYSERCRVIGHLVEAAVHSGHDEEARTLLRELEPLLAATTSPLVQFELRYARALLAGEEDAEEAFAAALAADLPRWPFARARVQLSYGAWLRRRRRVAESRAPLRAARDAFDALGVIPWGERARQELRAAGESSGHRRPEALEQLTPQELQIAQMAAAGLSNRAIGQRLYLSHRTVGTHLYRLFPKLGITSRAELAEALAGEPRITATRTATDAASVA